MSNVKGKTFTAPRCRVMVNGKVVGWGQNISVNVELELADVVAIDSIEDLEHAPVSYKVNGTLGNVWIVGTTYKSQGFVPRSGKDADEHLLNILQAPLHTLVLMDKAETRNLVTITKVSFAGHSMQMSAGAIGGRNVNWKAIRETDESEAAL
jgi:hypothetical protein